MILEKKILFRDPREFITDGVEIEKKEEEVEENRVHIWISSLSVEKKNKMRFFFV